MELLWVGSLMAIVGCLRFIGEAITTDTTVIAWCLILVVHQLLSMQGILIQILYRRA